MVKVRVVGKPCVKVEVGRDVCYVHLSSPSHKIKNTRPIGYTPDGDWILADLDDAGNIVGLELIGDAKPCQPWPSAGS